MARAPIQACIDRWLPDDGYLGATRRAAAEVSADPAPRPERTRIERERLALLTGKAWTPGRALHVGFLGGDPAVHARVAEVAAEWQQHANIVFEFGGGAEAEIRVSFARGGSWSYVGNDALGSESPKPTMNLGWLTRDTPEDQLKRVVLHEFGHTLGCVHEHQSPAGGIPWNRQAVYDYYAGPPNRWSRADVDRNVFEPYAADQTQFSQFDRDSIMLYPVPKELTVGGFDVGWNRCLSETDKSFIAERYPYPDALLPVLELGGAHFEAAISTPGQVNRYNLTVIEAGVILVETRGYTDLALSVFGPAAPQKLIAEDAGGGLGGNGKLELGLMPGGYVVQVRHRRETGTGKYQLSAIRKPSVRGDGGT